MERKSGTGRRCVCDWNQTLKKMMFKLKYLLWGIILFNAMGVFSQSDYYIDSLIVASAKYPDDTNKLNILNTIAENAGDDIWPMYNNELGKLAAKLQHSPVKAIRLCAKKHLAASLNNKGFYFAERGIAYKAVLYFNKSLAIQREISDKEGEAFSLSNLGTIYDSKGDIYKALEFYFASLKIREKLGNKFSLAQSYNNIAVLYNHQNDLENCIKYHFESLKIRQEINDPKGIALAYNNIGSTYTHLIETTLKGKANIPDSLFKKSLDYFLKGRDYYQQAEDEHGVALALFNIGDYYTLEADCFFQNNKPKYDSVLTISENYFNQAYDIFNHLGEKEWIANARNGLAHIFWRRSDLTKAIKNGEEAMAIARELGYPATIQNAADILRKAYHDKKDFERALEMSDLFYAMRDSVINDNNKKESLSKYFLYQNEKQQLVIKSNHEKIEMEFRAKTKQQRLVIYFVIVALLICAIFGILMYNRFKITKKQNGIIHHQKQIVEHQKLLVEESKKEILDSINYAKRIQYALLAHDSVLKENLNGYFVLFKPKDIVSGDFYWATTHSHYFYLAVCDSTGHGVPGAFMSLLNIGFMSEAIKEKNIIHPHEVLNYVRKRLIESISKEEQKDGMDGTLLCIDKLNGHVSYASAHNAPLFISNNESHVLLCDKMPVGKGERTDKFSLYTLQPKPGDQLYLFTDGYGDQFGGEKGKKYKNKLLKEKLFEVSKLPIHQQASVLNKEFEMWRGNLEQVDDVLVVGIRF